jgi:hypothetical protein
MPLLVRTYFLTRRWFEKALAIAWGSAWGCFTGLWLGVLTRESLHAIDEEYYTRSKRGDSGRIQVSIGPGEPNYYSAEYNKRGLWEWEKKAISEHFADCEPLLVIGAGGGREVLALLKLGYDVDGFESHPGLVAAANGLLRSEGYDPVMEVVPRDEAPKTGTVYEGAIVGWGMYMLVHGRDRRIALLQQLRAQLRPRCPVLISFYYRTSTPKAYKLATSVANVIRLMLRRPPAEAGDWLQPNYVHYFTENEVSSELAEAGFSMIRYSTEEYGCAVGLAN